jgi:hypothetical protein
MVEGTVSSDAERGSAIWIREDPRSGPPFLTVVLEPMPKATVDDVRLAVGALVRWRNAIWARVQRPFAEEDALSGILALYDQAVERLGRGAKGIYVQLAHAVNQRITGLLRDYVNDLAIQDEARNRILAGGSTVGDSDALEDTVRQIILERYRNGDHQGTRYHSLAGLTIAQSYLRALGYSPDAAVQICERAAEDIGLWRDPFSPGYPCDRHRVREVVRKALRKQGKTARG